MGNIHKHQEYLQSKRDLDIAIEKHLEILKRWEESNGGGKHTDSVVTGWVIGIATSYIDDDEGITDNLVIESHEQQSTFISRGIADATYEAFTGRLATDDEE